MTITENYFKSDAVGFTITKVDRHGFETLFNEQTGFDAETIEDMYSDIRNWWDEASDCGNELNSADFYVYVYVGDKQQERFRMDELL